MRPLPPRRRRPGPLQSRALQQRRLPPLPDQGHPARLVERRSRLRRNQTFPPRRHGRPPPGHRRWHRPQRLGGLSGPRTHPRQIERRQFAGRIPRHQVAAHGSVAGRHPADATVGLGRSHDASQNADSQPGYRIVELPESGASLKGLTAGNEETNHGRRQSDRCCSRSRKLQRDAATVERTPDYEIREAVKAPGSKTASPKILSPAASRRRSPPRRAAAHGRAARCQNVTSRADIKPSATKPGNPPRNGCRCPASPFSPKIPLPEGAVSSVA